jgi:hypothetical protein
VPFFHFFPNFSKGADPALSAGQPLSYYLLNLFINDREFFYDTSLGKLPYPNLYVMFVGWIPVILALLSIWMNKKDDRRWLVFLAVSAALVLVVGSTLPLQWIKGVFPGVTTLRFITMIGGLAVPAIIALASYALHQLLQLKWPRLTLLFADEVASRYKGISLNLVLLIPLIFAIYQAYSFSQTWLYTERVRDGVLQLLDGLETPDLQWVQPPFGEHIYIEPAVRSGMKLSPGIMTWQWKKRVFPRPVLEANRKGTPPGAYEQVDEIDGVPIYRQSEQTYAQVISNGLVVPCTAQGIGGQISVDCEVKRYGKLVVQENMYSGWKAWMDGEQISLVGERWLEVNAPKGSHTFEFRYQPWDVLLGLVLCLIGTIACLIIWYPGKRNR